MGAKALSDFPRLPPCFTGEKGTFFDNKQLQASIIRQIEVIGEATKNVSPSLKEKYPEIPWKEISGMRDMLIHEYFEGWIGFPMSEQI